MIEIIDKTKLNINNKIIDLSFEIKDKILLNDRVLILFGLNQNFYSNNTEEEIDRNILAYDLEGNFLWRIQRVEEHFRELNPFIGMNVKNGLLTGYNVNCCDYIIDPEDGRVTRIVFPIRRPW